MKKVLTFFSLFCLAAINLSAQTVIKNSLPKDMSGVKMNFDVDFSKALIFGMTEAEFCDHEKDWKKDKKFIAKKMKNSANYALGKHYSIGDYNFALYTIVVTINTITKEGYIICDAQVVDNSGVVRLQIEELSGGKEPLFMPGSKLAKIKFWSMLTGERLGKILSKEFSHYYN